MSGFFFLPLFDILKTCHDDTPQFIEKGGAPFLFLFFPVPISKELPDVSGQAGPVSESPFFAGRPTSQLGTKLSTLKQ